MKTQKKLLKLSTIFSSFQLGWAFPSTPACPNPVDLEFGFGCVCTVHTCGSFPVNAVPPSESDALLITTSLNDGFFRHQNIQLETPAEKPMNLSATMKLSIDPNVEYQETLGFGAAITDSSAYVLTDILGPNLSEQVLQQAFGFANFTMARVPMNAADFSRMDYSLAHLLDLSDFCLRDDRTADGDSVICGEDYKLEILERITQIQPELKLIVSSWSAPPSFKTQNFTCSMNSHVIECSPDPRAPLEIYCLRTVSDPETCVAQRIGVPCEANPPNAFDDGFPVYPGLDPRYNPENIPNNNADGNCYHSGFLREDAYEAWANMYVKFIEAYKNRSVPVWGITSQNEPFTQTGLWNSNFWTSEGLTTFVNDFLTPAIRKIQPDMRIMTYEDQLINLTNAAIQIAEATIESIDGIAFHWYSTLEAMYENTKAGPPLPGLGLPYAGGGADVKTVYDKFNGTKFLLMTESCSGYLLGSQYMGPRPGSMAYGYNTAHDILWNMRNRAAGYVYWNLILDSFGGPNLAGNYVDSPMYAVNSSAFVMNPSFFYLAHFSRAIPPGSTAIEAVVDCGASNDAYCQYVAFRTPEGNVVVVMTNDEVTTDIIFPLPRPDLAKGEGAPIQWTIQCGSSFVSGILPWKGIQTVIMPCLIGSSSESPAASSVTPTEMPTPHVSTGDSVAESNSPSSVPTAAPIMVSKKPAVYPSSKTGYGMTMGTGKRKKKPKIRASKMME